MKYIPVEKLKAEIERLKNLSQEAKMEYIKDGYTQNALAEDYRLRSLKKLLSFITSLQQEQQDCLMEEVQRYYSENFSYITSDQPTLSILTNIARHFAEWGAIHLNARKEE